MKIPESLKYWLPQSWSWFTTPSGSEPPSDIWIVKFIRKCQSPIIAHPLGAAALFVFFYWLMGLAARETFLWGGFFMFWWQWNVWEANNSISYPPREVLWRMILGLVTLSLLLWIF